MHGCADLEEETLLITCYDRRIVRLLLCLALVFLSLGAGICYADGDSLPLNSAGVVNRTPSVDPTGQSEGFSAVLYNNPYGLPTSEANAIAETEEGFIWIGSYSGLVRHDGNSFERLDSSTGISSVISLYVDSRDRLWIGTNDTGVFVMDHGDLHKWDMTNGLPAVNIRAIAEDTKGNVYIATTAGISVVDPDMNISILSDPRLADVYISDIRLGSDGLIYGLTQIGDLFTVRDGEIRYFISTKDCRVGGIIGLFAVGQCALHIVNNGQNGADSFLTTIQNQFGFFLQRAFTVVVELGSLVKNLRFQLLDLFLSSLQRVFFFCGFCSF